MDDVAKIIDWLERELIKEVDRSDRYPGSLYQEGTETAVRDILRRVKEREWEQE